MKICSRINGDVCFLATRVYVIIYFFRSLKRLKKRLARKAALLRKMRSFTVLLFLSVWESRFLADVCNPQKGDANLPFSFISLRV
jgi:hypothetical protein